MSWVCIAYKPSSSDYCRGCLMASYYSDFEMLETEERDEVVKFITNIEFRNENLEINESGYEITIIKGEEVRDTDKYDVEEGEEPFPHLTSLYDDAKLILYAKLKAQKEQKALVAKKKAEKAAVEREARERTKLAELKAKYDD